MVQINFNANLEIVYTLIIPIAMVHVFEAIGEMMALMIVLMVLMKKFLIMITKTMTMMLMIMKMTMISKLLSLDLSRLI